MQNFPGDPPAEGWENTLVYVGIATVRGAPGFRLPVYASPTSQSAQVGSVVNGGFVPHFRVTGDHLWLEVTLHDGTKGWMRNDPAHVTVTLPDPSEVTLVIDPGHGGTETGAVANGIVEKDINFDIAYWKLRPLLLGDRRINRVWYTRNGDYTVSLQYRWDMANASFANLFVSVHNNASAASDPDTRGTETYFKCGREGTQPLIQASRRAACLVQTNMLSAIGGLGIATCPPVDLGVICRQVSQTDRRSYYYVLQNSNTPAILAECAYVSNPEEARCLATDRFRAALAQGIYAGIRDTLFTAATGTGCTFRTLYGI